MADAELPPTVVALLLPSGDVPGVEALARWGLGHPAGGEGFRELTNGSRLGLVTLQQPSTAPAAVAMAECRERVNHLLHSIHLKETSHAQKWPLHDSGRMPVLMEAMRPTKMAKMAEVPKALRDTVDQTLWFQTAGRIQFLDHLRSNFGEAISVGFAWQVTYMICLLCLAFASIVATPVFWANENSYHGMMPAVSFLVITWAILVTENQEAAIQKLEYRWRKVASLRRLLPRLPCDGETSETSSEHSFVVGRPGPTKKALWKEFHAAWSPAVKRLCKVELLCAPLLLMQWLFIWGFFLAFFWLELWTIFEWGGCREYNQKFATRDCMTPDFLYPVWGKVFGAIPAFAQGVGLELVSGLSKMSVDFLVSLQKWDSNEEMRFAAVRYYFLLEVVGKLGFICVLGFLYVPDYGATEVTCSHRLDYWFFGNWSFSCLKANLPRNLRLRLLSSAVRGPFLISGLLGIWKTTFLPILVERLRTLESHGGPCQCLVRVAILLLRLMLLLLHCDWRARGIGEAGSLFGQPTAMKEPAEPWEGALKQGRRRPFDPFEEYVELLLHFLWVSCFMVVWPLGGLLAFANQVLELRCDTLKLLAARRRPFPSERHLSKVWVPLFAKRVVHIAIVMNVLVLLLPYGQAAEACKGALNSSACVLPTMAAAAVAIPALELYWVVLQLLLKVWAQRSPPLPRIQEVEEEVGSSPGQPLHVIPSLQKKPSESAPRAPWGCCVLGRLWM